MGQRLEPSEQEGIQTLHTFTQAVQGTTLCSTAPCFLSCQD